MNHEPAGCEDVTCDFCDGFATGWTRGKVKMAAEIEERLSSFHAADCGCVPCGVVEAVRAATWRPEPECPFDCGPPSHAASCPATAGVVERVFLHLQANQDDPPTVFLLNDVARSVRATADDVIDVFDRIGVEPSDNGYESAEVYAALRRLVP